MPAKPREDFTDYRSSPTRMEGKITSCIEIKNYLLVTLRLENGVSAKTYIVKGFKNEQHWSHFKAGDLIGGLEWFDKGKKIVSADSPAYRLD